MAYSPKGIWYETETGNRYFVPFKSRPVGISIGQSHDFGSGLERITAMEEVDNPVKVHCSVLAENAIKAAVDD
ncbi:hypothetical protein J4421_02595 [Candidatus Woesearchaeota archaeon]|nr:hypothetical protein [Candidatus Woesearchaeota archaeon]